MLSKDRKPYYEYAFKHVENWFPECNWLEDYFSDRADNFILVDDVVTSFSDFLRICPDRIPSAGIPKLEYQPDIKTLDGLVRRMNKSSASYFYSLQWDGCSDFAKHDGCREISFHGKSFVTPTSNLSPIETLDRSSVTMPFSCLITKELFSEDEEHVAKLVKGFMIEILDADGVFISFRKNLN
ncbi:hypothetical protein [Ruegeria arenilitoris]|uniref:hypothetical protein n=1 Tax=Ruegeria arenilitoris TaxID=1173585 RepID=UPI001480BF20|nr:hypothetical protein [Ruegeria arenilitoris]